ncbi:MAG TPA: phage terminase large subunit family protein [Clostridia bacterium]|nr:phage terminase large subunit family protein [Clostridia bacterium]
MKQKTIDLFKKIVKSVAPPPQITISQWAEKNRVLSRESSSQPGKWSNEKAPYQVEIMDAITDPLIEKVIAMMCSQSGKNEILNNAVGYFIDIDPCPILWIEPSLGDAEDYSKRRLDPLFADTKVLRDKVSEKKSRDSDNTILYKEFPGGSISLVGANSPRKLASKPIRVLIADEISGFPVSSGKEGDPLKLAEKRTITYPNRKKIFVSSPGIKGACRVEEEYLAGTQEKWRKKCPECGTLEYINLNGVKFKHSKDEKGNYKVWDIIYQCSQCGAEFDEYDWMRAEGKWIADNPNAEKIRSFHINAFVSPWWKWEDIILEWLKVKKDPAQYQVFKNTVLGETWEEEGEFENEDVLLERREEYPAEIPDGVLLLVASVDVQDDRFEYEVVGYGRGEETWGIEKGMIMGVPDKPGTWQLLSDKLDTVYHFGNGLGMKIACSCVDSGGHYTDEVYKFCKANERRRIFAIKGMGGPGYPLLYKLYRSKKEKAAVFILGVDSGKAKITGRLKIIEKGPGYCHFPKDESRGYDRQYFKGLISEKLVKEKQKGQIRLVWKKVASATKRNEPLDLRNYAQAAFEILNPNLEEFEKRLKNAIIEGKNTMESLRNKPKRKYGVIKKGLEY